MTEQSPLQQAQSAFLDKVPMRVVNAETVSLWQACDRVSYQPVNAPMDSPPYHRSIVEGFVVHSSATGSATEDSPVAFKIVGKVAPGDRRFPALEKGQAIEVATGSIIADGEFAVVRMWEADRQAEGFTVKRPFPPGFFIEQRGCDVSAGKQVIAAGTRLQPADIATLASLGIREVEVAKCPVVALFASGDEVIAHAEKAEPGMIYDCNTPMLRAAVCQQGGQAEPQGIMSDDFESFTAALKTAVEKCDLVIISGGTAAGGRDFISDLIRELGDVLVDGVPMRSGRPLIMGMAGLTPIIGVAGHPPEALRGFRLFAVPALAKLVGEPYEVPADQ